MKPEKIFSLSAACMACLLLLAGGCAQTSTIALKFNEQDTTTYRVITEAQDSVEFEGSLSKDPALKGGCNQNKVEMTFTQQIESVSDKGNATAKITIKELKYLAKRVDGPELNFDSRKEKDKNSALAKLIGQSYTIEIAPTGQVSKVIDVRKARNSVKGRVTPANKAALTLLKPNAIEQLHSIPALPAPDKSQLRTGENWSTVKTVSFGKMGPKSYEKIYTLEKIEDQDGRKIAVIEMNAIPSSATAEKQHKEGATSIFAKMFDNTETYTGQLKFDSTVGKVEKCCEKLESVWFVVDPQAKDTAGEPDTIRMSSTRFYKLEKID